MANSVTQNLGPVTAYGYAKKHGYDKTEHEFGVDLANAAQYAHEAGEASVAANGHADNAAKSAEGASGSAMAAAQNAAHVDAVKQSVDATAGQVQQNKTAVEQSVATANQAVENIDTKKTEVEASLRNLNAAIGDAGRATTAAANAAATARKDKSDLEAVINAAGIATGKAEAATRTANQAAGTAEVTANTATDAAVRAEKAALASNTAAGRAEAATPDAEAAAGRAEASVTAAGTAKEQLDASVQAATTAQAQMTEATQTATQMKTDLTKATEDATAVKNQFAGLVEQANTLDQSLTQGVTAAEKAIAGIDQATGKVTYYVDLLYRAHVASATTGGEVDDLFAEWWWINWSEGKTSRVDLLDRWFGSVLDDGRVHGVKLPLFSTSTSPSGELTDDSVGLICEPSTDAEAGRDDFAPLPQFWCVEVSAEKNPDGSHEIYAVEHIDPIEQVRSGEHLCWVLQKNTYTKEWTDDQYHYMQMQCHAAPGFAQWPQGTDRTGRVYGYIGNPKYAAGVGKDGRITCGTGLPPANLTSHSDGVAKWRERGNQYAGASGCLIKWQLSMIWMKYAKKGNSGIIEGCTSSYKIGTAKVTESATTRIILSESDGAAFLVGSMVSVGTGTDYWNSAAYSIARHVRITSIETVSIERASYAAVNLDMGGVTFDSTVGTTSIFAMPHMSGYNDGVLGYDGSRTSPTGGKEPGLIQKTEFQNGAYMIVADEFWKWSQPGGAGTDYYFDCYTCHDQTKISRNAITSDYTLQEDLRLIFPGDTKGAWWYTEDCMIGRDRGVLWPRPSQAAGSGTGCKAGFYVNPSSDGIRAAWWFCYLGSSSGAGLPARGSYYSTSNSYWNGCVGVPGLSG